MKVVRPGFFMRLAVLSLCFCAVQLRASAVTPVQLVESKLQGATILTAKADILVSAVRDCVKENPPQAGNLVFAVLSGGRADADAIAAQIVVAAIEGLGDKPSSSAIASIVSSAVKATPAVVLEIVRAAVKASPKDAAQAIVVAAVKAIPDPKQKVNSMAENTAGFSKDGKEVRRLANENDENLLPIGEAIALAAQQASGLNLADLMNAANGASAQTTGGTGSAYYGYYYPPIVPLVSTDSTTTVVPQPTVVSK